MKGRETKGQRERQREIKGRTHVPLIGFLGPDRATRTDQGVDREDRARDRV